MEETPCWGWVTYDGSPNPCPFSFPTHDGPRRVTFLSRQCCSLQGPSFIVHGNINNQNPGKTQNMLHSSRPMFRRIYAVRTFCPPPPAGWDERSLSVLATPSDPRILFGIRICLAQQQDMTCRWKRAGGYLGTGPKRIGCRSSGTRSPGPSLPAPAIISGCCCSRGCGASSSCHEAQSRASSSERASGTLMSQEGDYWDGVKTAGHGPGYWIFTRFLLASLHLVNSTLARCSQVA